MYLLVSPDTLDQLLLYPDIHRIDFTSLVEAGLPCLISSALLCLLKRHAELRSLFQHTLQKFEQFLP